MIKKLRATQDSDKLQRRGEILDAAERLFLARPSGLASMDELAEASGVAKGTLYLYFPSKEEVLLSLHERHAETFFMLLSRRIEDKARFTLDDLFDLVRRHILGSPAFLPVATLAVSYMERSVPLETVIHFRTSIGAKVMEAGAQIERALDLPEGEGPRMIQYSFALILGLWQVTSCGRFSSASCPVHVAGLAADFPTESRHGLDLLWRGAINAEARKRTARPHPIKRAAQTGKAGSSRLGKAGSNRS